MKELELTREQQEAISEIDRDLQIIACAGSGKTEVITRRIANILQTKPDVQPENIVAFTFTEKAAASMKKRIKKHLGTVLPVMQGRCMLVQFMVFAIAYLTNTRSSSGSIRFSIP